MDGAWVLEVGMCTSFNPAACLSKYWMTLALKIAEKQWMALSDLYKNIYLAGHW